MKKKTRAALIEEREQARKRANNLVRKLQKEDRQPTPAETRRLEEYRGVIAVTSAQLIDKDDELRSAPLPGGAPKRSAIVGAMRALYTGKVSAELRALSEAGVSELRSAGVQPSVEANSLTIPAEARAAITAGGTGQSVIDTDIQQVLAPLRDRLVLASAGARYMTGLIGDVSFPAYSGNTATWAGENATATNGEGTFSVKTIKPKRLTTVVEVSQQFLLQDSVGAEEVILGDIMGAIATKLESTILGKNTIPNAPAALFATAPTNKGAVNRKRIVDLEASVEIANALGGSLAYVTTPKGKATLRSVEMTPNSGRFLANEAGTELNGYPLLSTNSVASKLNTDEEGLLFGDFSQMYIGQWGGMGIVIDQYTKAAEGMVRFIINTYWDATVVRDGAIVVASIK